MNSKQFVIIIGVTFVVIIIWIIADILHTRPSVPANPKLNTLLAPISPNFDQKVLDQIKQVTPLSDLSNITETIPTTPPNPSPVSTPLPLPSALLASASARIATSGGTSR